MKVILEQDKICKHSVRYSIDEPTKKELGLSQPFSIYVPNKILGENPPSGLLVTLDFIK